MEYYLSYFCCFLSHDAYSKEATSNSNFHFLWLKWVKAKLTKCEFLKSCIKFLGHPVDGDGILTLDSKTAAVQFPTPKSVENLHSFLGLAGYYRAFVKNFASIASPLTCFLKKDVPFL